jgi:hypothetical protein
MPGVDFEHLPDESARRPIAHDDAPPGPADAGEFGRDPLRPGREHGPDETEDDIERGVRIGQVLSVALFKANPRIAASQLARFGINVNSICPGVTRTSLYDQVIDELIDRLGGTRDEAEARAVRSIPLRRANDPEDIAALAVFLAGPGSRNVTGQSWNVDGGLVWD